MKQDFSIFCDAELYPQGLTLGSEGSACFDVKSTTSFTLLPGERRLVPLGIKSKFSKLLEVQVRSRSGLALKNGVIVLNAPGTIDSDYRGEWGAILYNTDRLHNFEVRRGDRIAQCFIGPVLMNFDDLNVKIDLSTNIDDVQFNEESTRSTSGFGSTGV